ncbi:MAG: hypothetical protein LBI04_10505 [Treponema sp.]|jgi:hypothetical protein|nr:hypothetical protein [Treponema sp.]
MSVNKKKKNAYTKKRLSLGNSKAVRAALCKLARQYNNDLISDTKIRNLTYVLNSILQADKFLTESELASKVEQLERLLAGEGGTMVNAKDIDSPYAKNLKKQLANEQQVNAELNNELLDIKRQLAGIRAVSTELLSEDVA